MEFETLEECMGSAGRIAKLLKEKRFVFAGSGPRPFWHCGPDAKAEIWPNLKPVEVVDPPRE